MIDQTSNFVRWKLSQYFIFLWFRVLYREFIKFTVHIHYHARMYTGYVATEIYHAAPAVVKDFSCGTLTFASNLYSNTCNTVWEGSNSHSTLIELSVAKTSPTPDKLQVIARLDLPCAQLRHSCMLTMFLSVRVKPCIILHHFFFIKVGI